MSYIDDLLSRDEKIIYTARKHWIAPIFATMLGAGLAIGGLVALSWSLFTEGAFRTLLTWGGWLALLVGVVMLVRAFIIWWSQVYLVTNQKVMKVSGIVRKTASGSSLEKINDTMIEQPALGRLLNYGTVQVLTASNEADLRYRIMSEPMQFRRAILDAKQDWERAQAHDIAHAIRSGQQAIDPNTAALPPQPVDPLVTGQYPPAPPYPYEGQVSYQQPPTYPPPAPPAAPVTGAEASPAQITELIGQLANLRDAGAITPEEFEAKKAELLGRL